jgi:hypothetical protein
MSGDVMAFESRGSRMARLTLLLATVALAATSCSAPVEAPPTLTSEGIAALQVRAMVRAWDGVTEPVCTPSTASVELRAEIEANFPIAVDYYENREDLRVTGASSDYRCLVLQPWSARTFAPGIVGVEVWAERGDLNAIAAIHLFRWNGSAWVDTTPEETGVTVTTSVS